MLEEDRAAFSAYVGSQKNSKCPETRQGYPLQACAHPRMRTQRLHECCGSGWFGGAHRAIDILPRIGYRIQSAIGKTFSSTCNLKAFACPAFWITVQEEVITGMPLAPTTKAGRLSASPTAMWMFTDGRAGHPNPSVMALAELGRRPSMGGRSCNRGHTPTESVKNS